MTQAMIFKEKLQLKVFAMTLDLYRVASEFKRKRSVEKEEIVVDPSYTLFSHPVLKEKLNKDVCYQKFEWMLI